MHELAPFAQTRLIASWKALDDVWRREFEAPRWLFRGQADPSWALTSSLERSFHHVAPGMRARVEAFIIRQFQRKRHLLRSEAPQETDLVEWLALMQHYGAPSRLLDWTRSPHVASYFAFAGSVLPECVIWAIDSLYLQNDLYERIPALLAALGQGGRTGSPEVFRQFVMDADAPAVLPVVPFRQNTRLSAQQGVFLVPARIDLGFEENLRAHFDKQTTWSPAIHRLVVSMSQAERMDALRALRKVNIHPESLFPGLEGYAKSIFHEGLFFAAQLENDRFIYEGHWDDMF